MKRKYLILISLSIIITLLLLSNKKTGNLQVIKKSSYFSNFYVERGKVYIQCEIAIKNNSNNDKKFKVNALLGDDMKLGLLKNKNLKGYNKNLTSDEFSIKKKSTLTKTVIFIGDYAGT